MEADHAQEYYVLPLWYSYTLTIKSSKAKNGDEKLNEDTDLKTHEEPVDQEDQAFLEELERLKRQEKDANDAAKTFRKIVKTASTPIETKKPLVKDEEAADVDVHLYRFMIGSLMYLTTSRPDIMYLKGQPKLSLWYLRESVFDLEAYSDSDYARANLDRKSTTGEAEYVAAASCYGQVLWI
uniref:Uncharacterized protein n=1 Tax=Tanacetum cinerariifolium TaxID=118510 RepID=A0A6L2K5T6_TANCI|nr:hypothetical protein [Tanacetum cinerariifolium]